MHEKQEKIVSLVPSWTETLVECGLNVVARTRFCVHPDDKVKNIPIVGGTKNLKLSEILKLKPDFVILDKEENKKEMADVLVSNGIQILVSHVEDIKSAADFLSILSEKFENKKLQALAESYKNILQQNISTEKFFANSIIQKNADLTDVDLNKLSYVIWKNPYMLIGANTFIYDIFLKAGIKLKSHQEAKYPQVSEEEILKTYCLFSTEPYPFAKEFDSYTQKGIKAALIDGEKISWYGIRNINFLLACLK